MNFSTVLTMSIGFLAAQSFAAAADEVLTNATQVRALTVAQAERHIPVQLRGVVVGEAEPEGRALVIYDGTAYIYLTGPQQQLFSDVNRGNLIEVEGVSDPGGFAPIVILQKLKKLGTGKIPEPRSITVGQLLNGNMDAQWVKISGVVRKCEPTKGNPWQSDMLLETDGRHLLVRINNRHASGAYVDAEVTLRGLCFSQENNNRQLTSPMLLWMPHDVPVLVNKPSPPDPYDLPLRPVSGLFQFDPKTSYEHRVRVRGIVTYCRPEKFLWIRDGDKGLRVECDQAEPLQPGDEVDVAGFPEIGDYTPVLEDAVFKKWGVSPPPEPVYLTNTFLALGHDADLVSLDARLVEKIPAQDGWTFVLDWNGAKVKGLLRLPLGQSPPANWRDGSIVRISGICSVVNDTVAPVSGVWEPETFNILMRSPSDLMILQLATWWTLQHAIWVLGIISGALLLTIGLVIFMAQRRLYEQIMRRSLAEREFSAILNERNRIAREIHDTLAQGLGAISMRLELVKKRLPPDSNGVTKDLEAAHSLVRTSLAEMRNSVWNLHSQVLDTGDLATALEEVLRLLTEGTEIQSQFNVSGGPQRLPPALENNLLRAGQEAVTNAIRHAQAKKISVTLEFQNKCVRLRVHDDGKGFDINNPPPSSGGFGLMGMRERIEQSHGQMILQSDPQTGTEVILQVPVAV